MMQSAPRSLSFRAPRVLFWTAFLLRLAVILIGHTYRIRTDQQNFNFAFEAGRIARSLVTGHGYANPFNGNSGPSAWLPPLYPLLVALSFKLFGVYTRGAAFFLLAANSLFSALTAPAIYEIAARIFDANGIARRASKYAAPVALWSAWIWAVYPAFLQYAIHWLWEMSLTTCLFTWTLVIALRLRRIGEPEGGTSENPKIPGWPIHRTALGAMSGEHQPPASAKNHHALWTTFGLLWGLVSLSNPSLDLVLPATLLWLLWPHLKFTQNRVPTILGATLACIVFAATISPWVIRNEITLHAFIPTRDNFGAEFHKSVLPSTDAFPWGTTLPLWPADPEFQRFASMGEVAFSRQMGAEAKADIRQHPGIFLHRTIDRFFFFWDGTPHPINGHPAQEYLRQLSYCFLTVCGVLGLLLALKRRVPAAALMAFVFLLIPLPYYFVTVQPRFRNPIEPLIAILGVYLFRSVQSRSGTSPKATH
jgi:hypothetical protein